MSLRSLLPARLAVPGRFPALRAPAFRRFWYATLVQDVATWLLFAAQGWLLLQRAPQAEVVALFFALRLGPKTLLGLPAGALCERWGAARLLPLVRFAGPAPALLVLGAAACGSLSVGVILASAALTSVLMAFDQPGHRTLLHGYAPGDLLVSGVALNAIAATVATLVGPLLLALAVVLPGTLWAFAFQ